MVLWVAVGGRLGRQDTFVVAGMGGVAIPLLVHREVHIRNLLVTCEVGKVSWYLAGAGISIVGSVEATRETIPPVVESLDGMGWVGALSQGCVIVASMATSGIVAVVAGAVTIVLCCRGCVVRLGGGQGRWWWWHLVRSSRHVVD